VKKYLKRDIKYILDYYTNYVEYYRFSKTSALIHVHKKNTHGMILEFWYNSGVISSKADLFRGYWLTTASPITIYNSLLDVFEVVK
jgi:hypothetical protein